MSAVADNRDTMRELAETLRGAALEIEQEEGAVGKKDAKRIVALVEEAEGMLIAKADGRKLLAPHPSKRKSNKAHAEAQRQAAYTATEAVYSITQATWAAHKLVVGLASQHYKAMNKGHRDDAIAALKEALKKLRKMDVDAL